MLRIVMGLYSGCGIVWSSHALWIVWVHTELSSCNVEVICVVYCVTLLYLGGYLVRMALWKACALSASEYSPHELWMRSRLDTVVPLLLMAVQFTGRVEMMYLTWVSVLLRECAGYS